MASDLIAICQNPHGEGSWFAVDSETDRCPECDCTPKLYVARSEAETLRTLVRDLCAFIPYERPERGPLPGWIVAIRDRADEVLGVTNRPANTVH